VLLKYNKDLQINGWILIKNVLRVDLKIIIVLPLTNIYKVNN